MKMALAETINITGNLITPTIFLTAAHCVVTPYTPPGSEFYVSFASDLYAKGMKAIKATGYVYDPEFGHDVANYHDLALIFLPKSSTNGITPLSIAAGKLSRAVCGKGRARRAAIRQRRLWCRRNAEGKNAIRIQRAAIFFQI